MSKTTILVISITWQSKDILCNQFPFNAAPRVWGRWGPTILWHREPAVGPTLQVMEAALTASPARLPLGQVMTLSKTGWISSCQGVERGVVLCCSLQLQVHQYASYCYRIIRYRSQYVPNVFKYHWQMPGFLFCCLVPHEKPWGGKFMLGSGLMFTSLF